jgi:hypothetical protein
MDTILFSRGEWPYRDNGAYPFHSSNYPPLFHVGRTAHLAVRATVLDRAASQLLGTLVRLERSPMPSARPPRRDANRRRAGPVVVGGAVELAFLASNYVCVGPLFRQHMFMVMFGRWPWCC